MISTIRDLMTSGETLVFGHRGAMAYAPMNTIAAFELAKLQGADGIELDVQLSSDGYPVVLHDATVDGTTDGTGKVSEMTLAELKALDAGGWFSSQFSGERIPVLDDVFEALANDILINVEVKLAAATLNGIEEVISRCIQRHQFTDRVIISSFNPRVLQRLGKLLPEALIGVLSAPATPVEVVTSMDQLRHEARHPWHEDVDDAYMRWARVNHFFVNAWTVNEPERALQLRALGVNAVITDNPDRIVAAFSS